MMKNLESLTIYSDFQMDLNHTDMIGCAASIGQHWESHDLALRFRNQLPIALMISTFLLQPLSQRLTISGLNEI
jgi:hypothetical protein